MSAGSSNKRFKARDFLWCIPLSVICCPCLCGVLMRDACIDHYKSDGTASDKAELDHQETCRTQPPRPVPLIRRRAISSTPGRWSRRRINGQAQSMLLSKLPQEIRQMIWTLVLGERFLHIVQWPKQLTHKVCQHTHTGGDGSTDSYRPLWSNIVANTS